MGGEPRARTLTLLFTDLEGSTRALQQLGDATYGRWLTLHNEVIDQTLSAGGGRRLGDEGDALFYVFDAPTAAVEAAVAAQRALASAPWPGGVEPKVRIGMHTGEVLVDGEDHRGLAVHQAARVRSAAHGGQVLVSGATAVLVDGRLSAEIALRDLGHHRLKDLDAAVHLFQVTAAGLRDDFPDPVTLDIRPHNVPVQTTRLVGRTAELDEVSELVRSPEIRLITLTGPGGIGKTRLATEVAVEVAGDFPNGAWFVDLSSLRDPTLLPTTILTALDVPEESGRTHTETLIDHLRDQHALLVCDNFEHLLDGAELVSRILTATPAVTVLVTSRAALRLRGERQYVVPPLSAAESGDVEAVADAEATALFVQCALAVNPDFSLTPDAAAAVADICSRLDGLPLGIELAASRVKMMSPADVLDRLDDALELSAESRDAPERQRSLGAAIAWSYDLLGAAEQRVLRWVSVFDGGCTLVGAEAVLGAGTADALASLVDQSLVRRVAGRDGSVRFVLFETIRDFAADRLAAAGEAEAAREAHARWIGALAEMADEALRGPDQIRWLDGGQAEIDNIRAALRWASEADPGLGVDIVVGFERLWTIRGYADEARETLESVVERHTDPDATRVRGLQTLARLREPSLEATTPIARNGAQQAAPQLEDALMIALDLGDPSLLATSLVHLARVRPTLTQSFDDSKAMLEHALEIADDLDDEELALRIRSLIGSRGIRGFWRGISGAHLAEERVEAARRRGDAAAVGQLQAVIGGRGMRDPDGSKRRALEESLEVARRLGDEHGQAQAEAGLLKARMDNEVWDHTIPDDIRKVRRWLVETGHDEEADLLGRDVITYAMSVGDHDGAKAWTEHSAASRFESVRFSGKASRVMFGVLATIAALLSTAPWVFGAVVMPWGVWAVAVLAVGAGSLQGRLRHVVMRTAIRAGRPKPTRRGPRAGAAFVAFALAYLFGAPAFGPVLLAASLVADLKRPYGVHPALSRTLVGAFALAAIAGLFVAGPDAVTAGVLVATVAGFGWNAGAGPPVLRVGQAALMVYRCSWPILAVSAFAAHRGVPFGPWLEWTLVSTPVAVVLAALAFAGVTSGRRDRFGSAGIVVAAVCLGAAANGYVFGGLDLVAIGAIVMTVAHASLSLEWWYPDPIVRVPRPDEIAAGDLHVGGDRVT